MAVCILHWIYGPHPTQFKKTHKRDDSICAVALVKREWINCVHTLGWFFAPVVWSFSVFLLSSTAAAEEEEKQKAYDPWGRPGAGAPQKKPESDSQEDSQFRTKEVLSLYCNVFFPGGFGKVDGFKLGCSSMKYYQADWLFNVFCHIKCFISMCIFFVMLYIIHVLLLIFFC